MQSDVGNSLVRAIAVVTLSLTRTPTGSSSSSASPSPSASMTQTGSSTGTPSVTETQSPRETESQTATQTSSSTCSSSQSSSQASTPSRSVTPSPASPPTSRNHFDFMSAVIGGVVGSVSLLALLVVGRLLERRFCRKGRREGASLAQVSDNCDPSSEPDQGPRDSSASGAQTIELISDTWRRGALTDTTPLLPQRRGGHDALHGTSPRASSRITDSRNLPGLLSDAAEALPVTRAIAAAAPMPSPLPVPVPVGVPLDPEEPCNYVKVPTGALAAL